VSSITECENVTILHILLEDHAYIIIEYEVESHTFLEAYGTHQARGVDGNAVRYFVELV
jgi:hypothetical protein